MRTRRGFTLIEIMISVTILLVIMGAAVQFLRRQTTAVAIETQRMDALQNSEFAATQIERELREAGVGVADVQPMMVQLDSNAITFNANMLSIDTGDVRAVYQSLEADPTAVRVMYRSERRGLPTSSPVRYYPDSTYMEAKGFQSSAETISYFLTRDAAQTLADPVYTLYRRVNGLDSTVVARNIVKYSKDSIPFFTYFKQDTLGRLIPIDRNKFPLYHNIIHGSASDTGRSALTDSITVVRIHFVAMSINSREKRDSIKYRVVENKVRIMNSGMLQLTACGQPPLATSSPTLVQTALNIKPQTVTLTWTRSNDDGLGEKDIERYAIFRRPSTATQNGDPISSIPAKGATSYKFIDTGVQPGASYVYGVAAQDCTPDVSSVSESLPITVNP